MADLLEYNAIFSNIVLTLGGLCCTLTLWEGKKRRKLENPCKGTDVVTPVAVFFFFNLLGNVRKTLWV